MIAGGLGLGIWTAIHLPELSVETSAEPDRSRNSVEEPGRAAGTATRPAAATARRAVSGTGLVADSSDPVSTAPVMLVLDGSLPGTFENLAASTLLDQTTFVTNTADARLRFDLNADRGMPAFRVYFAAATRFDTVEPGLSWENLRRIWHGKDDAYADIVVLTDTLPALTQTLGKAGPAVRGVATQPEVVDAAWSISPTLTLLPFDQLTPSLVVHPIDGQNPVENASRFDTTLYPFVATVYAHAEETDPSRQDAVDNALAQLPAGNRLADRLTVLAMTGVTAMVRHTAAKMDELGPEWPAAVVGPELAGADITHVSNEVPFVPGCETNTSPSNLTFCSPPAYMAALRALGVDIVGLTGNHQNDFGSEAALQSLEIYAQEGLPVYGGGANKAAAFEPLLIEHNGNRLAFLGANSYGPSFAWATEFLPGSAEFDLNIMSAMIRELKESGAADVVLPELQYIESYNTAPLTDQRLDFGALTRAGADIVTGVQSHVAQAIEFPENGMILYGLGNLFFDQMWSDETREALIVKHTIYDGRHISTRLLPTVLHDYGQPRWATPEESRRILKRVFGASFERE